MCWLVTELLAGTLQEMVIKSTRYSVPRCLQKCVNSQGKVILTNYSKKTQTQLPFI